LGVSKTSPLMLGVPKTLANAWGSKNPVNAWGSKNPY